MLKFFKVATRLWNLTTVLCTHFHFTNWQVTIKACWSLFIISLHVLAHEVGFEKIRKYCKRIMFSVYDIWRQTIFQQNRTWISCSVSIYTCNLYWWAFWYIFYDFLLTSILRILQNHVPNRQPQFLKRLSFNVLNRSWKSVKDPIWTNPICNIKNS